jgi:hypothetical protein
LFGGFLHGGGFLYGESLHGSGFLRRDELCGRGFLDGGFLDGNGCIWRGGGLLHGNRHRLLSVNRFWRMCGTIHGRLLRVRALRVVLRELRLLLLVLP